MARKGHWVGAKGWASGGGSGGAGGGGSSGGSSGGSDDECEILNSDTHRHDTQVPESGKGRNVPTPVCQQVITVQEDAKVKPGEWKIARLLPGSKVTCSSRKLGSKTGDRCGKSLKEGGVYPMWRGVRRYYPTDDARVTQDVDSLVSVGADFYHCTQGECVQQSSKQVATAPPALPRLWPIKVGTLLR